MSLKALLILAVGLARVHAEDLQFCGTAPYYPSEYTCYDNNALCPTLYGQPTLPCNGACYSPDMYACSGGQLQLLPVVGPAGALFKLVAHSANPALNNRPAEVCGLEFNVGADAETCVYCYNAPPQYVCSRYLNETVLTPSGAMSVYVPGSQYWFLDPATGRLKTTAAGKASDGNGAALAGKAVTIYHEGYFSSIGSSYWLACKEQPDREVYGIFAPVGSSDPPGCERIKLATVPSTVPYEGAYSYT